MTQAPPDAGTVGDGAADAAPTNLDGSVDATLANVDGGGGSDGGSSAATLIRGTVQKGPFVIGSSLNFYAVNGVGAQTGQSFATMTSTDMGDFHVSLAYTGGLDVVASGYYYDEVSGTLSTSTLLLRALFDTEGVGTQARHVNILTHVAHDRALSLMADGGVSITAAESQAEHELVVALGMGGAGFVPDAAAASLDEVGPDSDQNAYLFAVSAVLMQAAHGLAGDGGAVDAQLQQLIDELASDLADDGQLASSWTPLLRSAERDLDVDRTMGRFEVRLRTVGSAMRPADLNRAVDSDGDGYRNSVDTCPLVANPNQSVVPAVVLCKIARYESWLPSGLSPQLPPLGTVPMCATVGHFEADAGQTQIVSCGAVDGGVMPSALLSLDDAGDFGAVGEVSLGATFLPSEAVDINGDGFDDLCAPPWTGWSTGMTWAASDGKGSFGAPQDFLPGIAQADGGIGPIGALSYTSWTVAFADFNEDTVPDLVGVGTVGADAGLFVQLGLGAGQFATPRVVAFPSWAPTAGSVVAHGDLNHDHHEDLVIGVWGPPGTGLLDGGAVPDGGDAGIPLVQIWEFGVLPMMGDGKGGFSPRLGLAFGLELGFGASLQDFDGDGQLDMFAWSESGDSPGLVVGFGDGAGGFADQAWTFTDTLRALIVAGDFNGDGKADIAHIISDPSDPTGSTTELEILFSTGRTFVSQQFHHIVAGDCAPVTLQARDINGDGTLDLLFVYLDPAGGGSVESFIMNRLR